MRIGIVGYSHETNTFALEQNHQTDALVFVGEDVLTQAHPKSYIGGFMDGSRREDVELVPIADVHPIHGGLIHASVFEHYRDMLVGGLANSQPLDGVYLHGL